MQEAALQQTLHSAPARSRHSSSFILLVDFPVTPRAYRIRICRSCSFISLHDTGVRSANQDLRQSEKQIQQSDHWCHHETAAPRANPSHAPCVCNDPTSLREDSSCDVIPLASSATSIPLIFNEAFPVWVRSLLVSCARSRSPDSRPLSCPAIDTPVPTDYA
jgi:hypothetical protein